jgi:hypothetical protein
LTYMLNFAINNETVQGGVHIPFLTNNPSNKEMSVMAKSKYSNFGCTHQATRLKIEPGDRFNRLTIEKELPRHRYPSGNSRRKFLCKCDCGNETETLINQLTSGSTKSCGCLDRERVIERSTKHGLCGHPLYQIWGRMRQATSNPNYTKYEYYGGMGITLCDEWMCDFKPFYDWAIQNGWKKGLVLDRIKNEEGYSPENCRFVSHGLSARNKRLLIRSNKSGYRGVCKQHKKWKANIANNNEKYHLGSFDTAEEAAHAYDTKAKELNAGHPLNFPDEVTI